MCLINLDKIFKYKYFRKGRWISSAFLCFLLIILITCNVKNPSVITGYTMGTTYKVVINKSLSRNKLKVLQMGVDSILKKINYHFSTYIDSSEISKFNRSTDKFSPSSEFSELLLLSKEIYTLTRGRYDPTVHPLVQLWGFGNISSTYKPPADEKINNILKNIGLNKIEIKEDLLKKINSSIELDFSAIAKGYGVDKVSQLLLEKGFFNFMVEIGGEVFCAGKINNKPWQIGIQNPGDKNNLEEIIKVLELSDVALATSGNYRNNFVFKGKLYSHTINPKTGYPVDHNVVSVSVIAKECATADAFATGLMVLGLDSGINLVEKLDNIEAIFITKVENEYKIISSSNAEIFFKTQ